MIRSFLPYLLVLLSFSTALSQITEQPVTADDVIPKKRHKCSWKRAEKHFQMGEHLGALHEYMCCYPNLKSYEKPECIWKVAECYRLTEHYEKAAENYKKAIVAGCYESEQAKIYLADSVQMRKDSPLERQKRNAKNFTVQQLVDSIARLNVIDDAMYHSRSRQEDNAMMLSFAASDSQLIGLTTHPNAAVRYYAFRALTRKPGIDLYPILLAHLKDNGRVTVYSGCERGDDFVNDHFLRVIRPYKFNKGLYKLSDQQYAALDSVILFNDSIHLAERRWLIRKLQPEPKYYSRMKELALRGDKEAVLALWKYQKPEDLPLVKNLFKSERTEYYGIKCALEIPDSSFYPLLVSIFDRQLREKYPDGETTEITFEALAKYPSPVTYELFKKAIQVPRNGKKKEEKEMEEYRYQTFCTYTIIAITKHPNPLLEPLKDLIKLDDVHQERVKRELKDTY